MSRQELKITEDGLYPIKPELFGLGMGTLVVYLSGDLGGGTPKLVYRDLYDNLIDLVDGTLATGSQYQVDAGILGKLYLSVVGSTNPQISLIVTGKV